MSEITLKCIECGQEFVWTEGEQAFYRGKGLPAGRQGLVAPTLCIICRAKAKARERDYFRHGKRLD